MKLSKKQIAMADKQIELNVSEDQNNPIWYRTLPVYEKLEEILLTTYIAITHLEDMQIDQHRKDLSILESVDELRYMVNLLVKDCEKKKRWA